MDDFFNMISSNVQFFYGLILIMVIVFTVSYFKGKWHFKNRRLFWFLLILLLISSVINVDNNIKINAYEKELNMELFSYSLFLVEGKLEDIPLGTSEKIRNYTKSIDNLESIALYTSFFIFTGSLLLPATIEIRDLHK